MEVRSIFYNAAKVILFSGFHVAEVAYDFVLQLKTRILSKGMLNSFEAKRIISNFKFTATNEEGFDRRKVIQTSKNSSIVMKT